MTDTALDMTALSPEEIEPILADAIAERDAAKRRYNDHIIKMRDPKLRADKRWLANAHARRPLLSADWDEKKANVIRLEQARQAAYRQRKSGLKLNRRETDLILRMIDGDDFTEAEDAELDRLGEKVRAYYHGLPS